MRVAWKDKSGGMRARYWDDLFHTVVSMSTVKVLGMSATVLITSWFVFAALFFAISEQCGLEAGTFMRSLYLSIETIETIGYGVPDPGLKGCYSGIFVLGAAALWESLLNALLISIVYTRLSRAYTRASSVCFTKKAIISQFNGHCYFMFQVCDFRKHQLCEAHVRVYGVQHAETTDGVSFQTRSMRLQHPDDELGGMLLLALPQLVVHRIDAWSPLCPPEYRTCPGNNPATGFTNPWDVVQRAHDVDNGSRDVAAGTARPGSPSLQEVAAYLTEAQMEVICLVEGIEPATSGTLQAQCSYMVEDVAFNASFQRCVSRSPDGTCQVDLDAFHDLTSDTGNVMHVQSLP